MKKQFFLFAVLLAVSFNTTQAATTKASSITIQGGNNSTVVWRAPLSQKYKVFVLVGNNGTASNALYRVYPKGNSAGKTTCLSTDATSPCFEIAVNQATNKGKWVQLTVNNDIKTAWMFVANTGYVSVATQNLSTTETLEVADVQFTQVAMPDYKTVMRARWKAAIAAAAPLKSAITRCLIENNANAFICTDLGTLQSSYGVTDSMYSPVIAGHSLFVFTQVTNNIEIGITPESLDYFGNCGFTLVSEITWNSTANFKVSWNIKGVSPIDSNNARCTNFVPYSTPYQP